MKRLLIYVHFNKYHHLSEHVIYQLTQLRSLFKKVIFLSNSPLAPADLARLEEQQLISQFIQRENQGYDFAAWKEGMIEEGFEQLKAYDSVTVMNDTCFGPLWDLLPYYQTYEADEAIDFWGMTNHQGIKAGNHYIHEHLQSYFICFKQSLVASSVFQTFWQKVEALTDVQMVIDRYETHYTKRFTEAGFVYASILDTIPLRKEYVHPNFPIHYPHVVLDHKVPFIKVKTFDLSQHLSPYTLEAIQKQSPYPVELITSHMSAMSLPTPAYLLARKVLTKQPADLTRLEGQRVAVHLHAFYLDLLPVFLEAFQTFSFKYTLFITTDSAQKASEIESLLQKQSVTAQVHVTGKKGRDIIPMFKLKKELAQYDIVGHFHTKKSPEAPYWVGDSWRQELQEMLLQPADSLLTQLAERSDLGLIIADIPSFFRYTKIVNPWNENRFADEMNALWQRMGCQRSLDFTKLDTFIMSYGTFVWFKYAALKPLFDLDLKDEEIPEEPLGQHTILHAIERILVYLAWDGGYDYGIAQSPHYLTPFIDNQVLNIRPELLPNTYVDFDHIGGIKGALRYTYRGPGSAIKYILRRMRNRR